MRRPLAVFGCSYLLCMLVVLRLPSVWLWLAALVCAGALTTLFLLWRKQKYSLPLPALILSAALLTILMRNGYDALIVRPVQSLAGDEALAEVRVVDSEPGYGPDTVHATLEVLSLDGTAPAHPFRVQVRGIEEIGIGDMVFLRLRFSEYNTTSLQSYYYGKGIYVGASALSAPEVTGYAPDFLCRVRLLQYGASENIREKLPLRLSSVVAAMAVGDKRYLSDDTVTAFRMAGLSHMLVVSGLHLSIITAAVYAFATMLLRNKKAASIACVLLVFFFMAFTGFTASIVRCGIMYIFVYTGALFARKADIYTSMGLAALLLCLQNPYAAADVGLLLSFASTLGALAAGTAANGLRRKAETRMTKEQKQHPLRRFSWVLLSAALVSCFVSLAILPVMAYAGMGFSLLTLPMNIIAVPLLTPVVFLGFAMLIPSGVPLLGLLARAAALGSGMLVVWLEKLTNFCMRVPGAWVPLGGLFVVAVVGGVYLLLYFGYRNRGIARRAVAFGLCAALLVPLALVFHLAFSRGTVTVMTAGGASPSVVVIKDREAIILYRGRNTDAALKRIFLEHNIKKCILLVDMRRIVNSTEYMESYKPEKSLIPEEEIINNAHYTPFADVEVYIKRQGDGCVACVDIGGYKIGITSGTVNLAPYAKLDLLVAGNSTVSGSYGALLVAGQPPAWAFPQAKILQNEGQATILVRPGKGVRYWEVRDGIGVG